MKTYLCAIALSACFFSVSCGAAGSSRYLLVLPDLPHAWEAILGSPHWQIEWFDAEGRRRTETISGESRMEVSPARVFANPVIAHPFWPGKGIGPGIFRPAGAIFPFDVSGESITLSWQGGVDATMFMELARAANEAADPPPGGSAANRLPWNFNWPRFRRIFDDPAYVPTLNAEVRADPWLADWPGIAARTVQSGFDRRRLVPQPAGTLRVPLQVPLGPWIGSSPFAPALFFEASPVFPVRAGTDTWVSAEGLLRGNTEAWMWREF